MTTHANHKMRTAVAAQDLAMEAQYKAVTLAGAIAGTTSTVAGILWHYGKTGDFISYVYEGDTEVKVGAAVSTLGFPLKIAASGWLTPAASGDVHVGRAMTTAASGDIVNALVDFKTLSPWPGV